MTNKLISLALLVFFLTTSYGHSENQFLFPKKKPSVFKKIERNIGSENLKNLPQKKPIVEGENKDVQKIEEKKVVIIKKKDPVNEKQINSNKNKKRQQGDFYLVLCFIIFL